ncbi:MAG: hypothetical protein ACKO5C_08995 [Ferruginibacter sp.]
MNPVTDRFEKRIDDTLIAGDRLCVPDIVEGVVEEGVQRIREIIEWGAHYNTDFPDKSPIRQYTILQ